MGYFTNEFWDSVDRLVADSRVIIDRPAGSPHPRIAELVYPLDYGYLEGTSSMDGGGIDVWVGSLTSRYIASIAICVDLIKRDVELKILIGCTPAEERVVIDFLNGSSLHARLVRREPPGMSLLEARRSNRSFRTEAVPQTVIEEILRAATWAPSAHNRQPWRFVVLTDPDMKAKLAQAMGDEFYRDMIEDGFDESGARSQVERSRQRIQDAPVGILFCLDISELDAYPDADRRLAETLMGVQSVAMAGENLLLAAHALGLAGVWVCAPLFAPQVVQRVLEIPAEWQPQGLVLLGYSSRPPREKPRRDLTEVIRYC